MDLSIIIPAKDEAKNLPELLAEIKVAVLPCAQNFEVIVIDDGSRDDSWEVLQKLKDEYAFLRAVRFQYNCGKASALSYGFSLAAGKYIATMDGDLQDNPAEIPEMLKMLLNGSDLVSG
jgi:glycosyltransferase involved in cell wall biosynthesis